VKIALSYLICLTFFGIVENMETMSEFHQPVGVKHILIGNSAFSSNFTFANLEIERLLITGTDCSEKSYN